MSDQAPFPLLLAERVRGLIEKDGRSKTKISIAAGLHESALSRVTNGRPAHVRTLLALLYELDAGPEDIDGVFADFAQCREVASQ